MIVIAGTTYRTGSTLMQRLINTSNEKLIYGEDNAILTSIEHYLDFQQQSQDRSQKQKQLFYQDKNSWTSNMIPDMGQFMTGCAYLINYLYQGGGFKVLSPTLRQIVMLKQLAPSIKVVLLYRNVHDSWRSYQEMYNWISREQFFRFFNRSRMLLRDALNGHIDYVYPLKYENINTDEISKVFDWLGIKNKNHISEVLSLKLREMPNFQKQETPQ